MKHFRNWILVAAILGAGGAWWLRPEKPRNNLAHAPDNNPLAQMFKPGALWGFLPSTKDTNPDSTILILTNLNSVAKIEVLEHIEAPDAETLLQDGIMGIQALYANALSPYPGDISNQVITDPAFRPRLFRATNGPMSYTYFLLYANDRLGYGATTKDSVKYKSLAGWLYCASRQEFFKVKLFTPPSTTDREIESMFMSLRCN